MSIPLMPLAARVVDHAISLLPADMRRAALAGRGNDRRIRRELARLHAAGHLAVVPSRRDMLLGSSYLARLAEHDHIPPAA